MLQKKERIIDEDIIIEMHKHLEKERGNDQYEEVLPVDMIRESVENKNKEMVELYKKLRPRVAMRKLRKKKERIGLTMSVEELKEIDKLRGDLSRSEYIKRKIFMSEPRDIFEEDYDKLRGMVTMVGGTLYKIRKFLEQGDLSKINDKEFAKSIIKHVRFSRESIEYYLKNN